MVHGQVRVNARGVARIRGGHLWIYRSDILQLDGVEPGGIVSVLDPRQTLQGYAFYSATSQIALRMLARTRVPIPIDSAFFAQRLEHAEVYRKRAGVDPTYSRRVYSEGDFLPGLIVDRYGEVLVVQTLIQGTDRLKNLLIELLLELHPCPSVLVRNDSRVRELEGLPLQTDTIGKPVPDVLVVNEGDRRIALSLKDGQKTGSYLDQRDNHLAVRRYARGRALDAFCYSGGFTLQIADLCDSVDSVDVSSNALGLLSRAIELNSLQNVRAIEANAFDFLRNGDSERPYDLVILDPPAFAKSKASLPAALRGYKEINLSAMRALRDGGILVTCSCSHHLSEPDFAQVLAEAAQDAGRWVRVLERRNQPADHPVLLTMPETAYLKCFVLEVNT